MAVMESLERPCPATTTPGWWTTFRLPRCA
jgi:hypothetical protein